MRVISSPGGVQREAITVASPRSSGGVPMATEKDRLNGPSGESVAHMNGALCRTGADMFMAQAPSAS
jgi:hypothetical protein